MEHIHENERSVPWKNYSKYRENLIDILCSYLEDKFMFFNLQKIHLQGMFVKIMKMNVIKM